jgi:SnoaL-like domain
MTDMARLEAAADRQEIADLIYRYCRAMDRMEHEQGYAIWHEDGTADYGPEVFQGSGRGFIDWVCESHKHVDAHSHQISNVVIEVAGDRAGSEAYVTATLRTDRDGKSMQMTVWSRYIDQWSKRDGRWGIDKRVTVMDFDEVREVTPMKLHTQGSRNHSDPSYAAVRALR